MNNNPSHSPLPQECFGVVHTDTGRYVMARMRREQNGTWRRKGIRQWQSTSVLRRILLFHRGISFGVASWWQPRQHEVPVDSMTTADTTGRTGVSPVQSSFNVVAHTAEVSMHAEELCENLIAVVPEDIFLVTIPLYLCQEIESSFVSIFTNETCCIIGVTIERNLAAVMHMTPGAPEKTAGYIGRVKRYWEMRFGPGAFPETIIVIGSSEIADSSFAQPLRRVAETENDIGVLRAMGTALAYDTEHTPIFAGQTPESSFRTIRTLVYGISAGLLVLGLLAAAFFSGMHVWYHKKKIVYEKEYQYILDYNKEIKKLSERNNRLAETILRLENTLNRRTIWAKFLHEIGKNKPADLHFERLGSEPVASSTQAIRIALMGWTPKEISVTRFIATLQDIPYVTQITLSSMERDKKNRSIYGFKIICTLLLNEQ